MKTRAKTQKHIVFMLLVLVIIFLSACQPTPEDRAVVSKKTDLVEMVLDANEDSNIEAGSDDELTNIEESKVIVEEQIKKINGHIKMEIVPNNLVTIKVDADVISPELDKIPFVRVRPKNFNQEQFNTFIEYCTGGEPVYYVTKGADGNIDVSKEEIEAMLPLLKGYLLNDNLPDYKVSHAQHFIELYEEGYEHAVNKADEKLYEGSIDNTPMQNGSQFTFLKCYLGNECAAGLMFMQSEDGTLSQMSFHNSDFGTSFNTYEPYEGTDSQRIEISYEEARNKALDFVTAIDGQGSNMVIVESNICYSIGTFANYSKETSPQAYRFSFARQYNGVEIPKMPYLYGGSTGQSAQYNVRIFPESLEIIISNDGFNRITWDSYTEKIEVLAEDTPLKAFDEIQDIFIQHCNNEFTWIPQNDAFKEQPSVTLSVDKVELNLMTIPEMNNMDNYITVPVWDFVGSMKYNEEVETQDGYPVRDLYGLSIVTINAIDGSIIDRDLGY